MNMLKAAVLLLTLTLYASAQNLPDGDGKATVTRICGSCHGLDYITGLKHTKSEWSAVVDQMIGYGAVVSNEDYDAIVTYLSTYLGTQPAQKMGRRVARIRPVPDRSSFVPRSGSRS